MCLRSLLTERLPGIGTALVTSSVHDLYMHALQVADDLLPGCSAWQALPAVVQLAKGMGPHYLTHPRWMPFLLPPLAIT